jgi:hypothetical protein
MKSISRRDIVNAASLLPFSAIRGTAANAAVKVGLIGAGGRGTFDAGHLVKDPSARLVALCDIFDDRIEQAKRKIQSKIQRFTRTITSCWRATWTP